jgi:hypothetical protein
MPEVTFTDGQSTNAVITIEPITFPGYYKVSPGSLASIVIGVSLFWIIVGACLFCVRRGRKSKRNDIVCTRRLDGEYHNLENGKSMSFCMFDPKSMVYIDGRPDISPLGYENNVLDYAGLTEEELSKLEPENNKPLLLFSGQFTSSVEERLVHCQDGYATRNFTTMEHQTVTVHYFRADRLHWFVNSVYSVMCLHSPQFTIQHIRGVIFNSPTPKNQYQYLWITSNIMQNHLLDRIIHDTQHPIFNNLTDVHFQSRSVYSILKTVALLEQNRLVHLNIQLSAFFYDDTKATTNWKIGSFTLVQHEDSNITHHQINNCTAPELLLEHGACLANPKMDSWSVGCVLYTLITGLPLFQSTKEIEELVLNDCIEQYVVVELCKVEDAFFKQLLLMLLTFSQTDRKTVSQVVQFFDSHSNYQ